MSTAKAPLGFGLYFIDVLACLLFAIVLALAGARFDREQRVAVQLPPIERSDHSLDAAPELLTQSITLREEADGAQIYLGEEPISLAELKQRFEQAPPPGVVLRSEASLLTEVVALVHSAGVHDLQIAYEIQAQEVQP